MAFAQALQIPVSPHGVTTAGIPAPGTLGGMLVDPQQSAFYAALQQQQQQINSLGQAGQQQDQGGQGGFSTTFQAPNPGNPTTGGVANSGSVPGQPNRGGTPPTTGNTGGGNGGTATNLNQPTGGGGQQPTLPQGGHPYPTGGQATSGGTNFLTLSPGNEHPFANGIPPLSAGIHAPPQLPDQYLSDRFMPDVFKQPFLQGLSAAGTVGSYAGLALPGAGNYQAGLYDQGMTAMDQNYLNASGYLGSLGMEQAFNQINDQYAGTPFQASKNKAYADAANQFSAQMMQTGAGMVRDRHQQATQNLPNVFQTPLTASGFAQETAGGLYGAGQSALAGEAEFPLAVYQSAPTTNPVYIP